MIHQVVQVLMEPLQPPLMTQPPLQPPHAMPVKRKEAPAGMTAFFQLQL